MAAREDALWRRQQELWDRDLARWQESAAAWAAREASLVQENAALRAQLLQLLTGTPGNLVARPPAEQQALAAPQAPAAQPITAAASLSPEVPDTAPESQGRPARGAASDTGSANGAGMRRRQDGPASLHEALGSSPPDAAEEVPAWFAQVQVMPISTSSSCFQCILLLTTFNPW